MTPGVTPKARRARVSLRLCVADTCPYDASPGCGHPSACSASSVPGWRETRPPITGANNQFHNRREEVRITRFPLFSPPTGRAMQTRPQRTLLQQPENETPGANSRAAESKLPLFRPMRDSRKRRAKGRGSLRERGNGDLIFRWDWSDPLFQKYIPSHLRPCQDRKSATRQEIPSPKKFPEYNLFSG